jgi:hypothetical protein
MSLKRAFLIAPLLIAASNFICLAQVEQGAISGAVVDSTGPSIPKAGVTATNQAIGAVATPETIGEEYYKLPYLLAGKYRVSVSKDGFSVNRVTDVPVPVGQPQNSGLTLDTDGAELPSDWYLRQAGEITRMFHGEIPPYAKLPAPGPAARH